MLLKTLHYQCQTKSLVIILQSLSEMLKMDHNRVLINGVRSWVNTASLNKWVGYCTVKCFSIRCRVKCFYVKTPQNKTAQKQAIPEKKFQYLDGILAWQYMLARWHLIKIREEIQWSSLNKLEYSAEQFMVDKIIEKCTGVRKQPQIHIPPLLCMIVCCDFHQMGCFTKNIVPDVLWHVT